MPPNQPAPKQQVTVWQQQSSPIPPPDWIREYELILPGSGQMLLDRWHTQSDHRMMLERRVVTNNIVLQYLGWLSATVFGLMGIGGGIYLASAGAPITGLAAMIGSVATLAGVFTWAKHKQQADLARKSPAH